MADNAKRHVLPDGMICFVPDGQSLTGFVLDEQGDWFEPELAFLRAVVQPGWTCVDVGASYGCYALSLARRAGPGGTVHAIEPHPRSAGLLERSAREADPALTAPIRIHRVAASDRAGPGLLTDPADPELAELGDEGAIEVPREPLAAILTQVSRIDLLKVDAEGHSAAVLQGAGGLLDNEGIIVQFVMRHGGRIQTKACDFLQRRGFGLYRLLPKLGVLMPIAVGEQLDPFLMNAFALREPARARLAAMGLLCSCVSEEDWIAGGTRIQDVLDHIVASRPFARWGLNWRPNTMHPGWDNQRRAVALGYDAIQADRTPDQRVAGLMRAYASLQGAMAQAMNGSRLITMARLSFLLGRQAEAVQCLERLLQAVEKGEGDWVKSFAEPMLLPCEEAEVLDYPDLKAMLRGVAVEWLLAHATFSMYFNRGAGAAVCESLRSLPVRSARAERVIALLSAESERRRAVVV